MKSFSISARWQWWPTGCLIISLVAPARAQTNIAPSGTPIFGASSALVGGADFAIVNQGSLSELNDGVVVTDPSLLGVQGAFQIDANGAAGQNGNGADTYAGTSTSNQFDFVGILFPDPAYGVTSVRVQHYLANDGGWWGPYSGAATSAPLSAANLTSPQVQVTTNGGATWSNVASATTDYVAKYTGVPRGTGFPNATAGPLATLTFSPQNNINGIRLIQNGAGNVDSGPGFIGVTEFQVFGVAQQLKLVVNTSSGQVSIQNAVASDIAFDLYKITSPSGSLNVAGWNSLQNPAGNPAGFPAGSGTGDGWEVLGEPADSLVAEAYLLGSSALAPTDAPIKLGNLFAPGGAHDLTFRYRTASGRFVDATDIQYVNTPAVVGDYNGDDIVDAADYVVWRKALGTSAVLYNDPTPGVTESDYAQWRSHFGQTAAGAGAAAVSAAVPEPATISLVLFALAASLMGGLRRRMATLLKCAIVAAGAFGVCETAMAQQTFGSLLNELVNRDNLAIQPNDGYTLHQASSYDRRATTLGAPFNYANTDTANFLGTTVINGQTEYVMLNDTGPGALTRWWMTGADNTTGILNVYIDGQTTPVLSGTIQQLISGSASKFGSSLSYQTRPGVFSGSNLYAPIPYSQSILVTYRGTVNDQPGFNPPVYYNIDYRKFQPSTSVTSYTTSTPTQYSQTVTSANTALANPTVTGNVSSTHTLNDQNLAAGQSISQQLTGAGAIRRLNIKVTGADQIAALRNTYVELLFDGQRTAQIPVGYFFGNGDSNGTQAYNPYGDFYRSVQSNGQMSAYWVMPYQNAAEVRLVNRGAQNVNVDLEIDSGAWQWNSNSQYFHADYRGEKNIATRGGNGTTDWTYLNVRGRGTYVGDTLAVRNGAAAWWGEGDEKVYIDHLDGTGAGNNAQPNIVGTGSEDYYGYAWSHPDTFSKPFNAQPLGSGNASAGQTVNSRVRGLDAIPFNKDFKFDMELWHWANTTVDYGATTYWYGTPGTKSLHVAADLGADYRAGLDLAGGGIPDRAGDGQWLYLSSSNPNPSLPSAQTSLLTFGPVGNAGHEGYGGGQNGHNLAAISDQFLFADGDLNQGIQGKPGYHELALHPAGYVASGSFAGDAQRPFSVARWIAGPSSAGLANITGSIRNFIGTGDGVDFLIYVDGQLRFTAFGNGTTLPERSFDFDVTLTEGSIVDFVLGNNDQGNLFGDESLLRAMIWTDHQEFLPVEGDLDGNGAIDFHDWIALRSHFNANFSRLSRQQAYAAGDLNGDLENNELDFALFKTAYEAAHGSGSFAQMLQGVAEPATAALLAVASLAWSLVASRRRNSFAESHSL
jgi:hypothetical protein